MNIAVFADIHGRLLLCFKVCARWEQETGQKIDLILQAGDLGAFPDTQKLDRGTLLHARHDPTELGFSSNFIAYDEAVAGVLAQTSCKMVFIRGNHEDHSWLDSLEKEASDPIFPIDIYQRVYCLKTGEVFHFQKGQESINILGIGRIAPPERAIISLKSEYIQDYERQRLQTIKKQSIDILLSHDKAKNLILKDGEREYAGGMQEIRQAVTAYRPVYHFFGHIGGPLMIGTDLNKVTSYCKPADFTFQSKESSGTLEKGSMVILKWQNKENHSIEVIDDSWFNQYRFHNWMYL